MNKKAIISPFVIIAIILGILLVFYLVLYLPIPQFKSVRAIVEYFIILALWFVFQAGFIYFYFRLSFWSIKLFKFYKEYVFGLSLKIKKFIQVHT